MEHPAHRADRGTPQVLNLEKVAIPFFSYAVCVRSKPAAVDEVEWPPMAKKKAAATPASPRPSAPRKRAAKAAPGPAHHEIAEAAYHRYLRRGAGQGTDTDDWLDAEKELRDKKR